MPPCISARKSAATGPAEWKRCHRDPSHYRLPSRPRHARGSAAGLGPLAAVECPRTSTCRLRVPEQRAGPRAAARTAIGARWRVDRLTPSPKLARDGERASPGADATQLRTRVLGAAVHRIEEAGGGDGHALAAREGRGHPRHGVRRGRTPRIPRTMPGFCLPQGRSRGDCSQKSWRCAATGVRGPSAADRRAASTKIRALWNRRRAARPAATRRAIRAARRRWRDQCDRRSPRGGAWRRTWRCFARENRRDREEIDRTAHTIVAAARRAAWPEESPWPPLDFLAQEFNREANTLPRSQSEGPTALGLELKKPPSSRCASKDPERGVSPCTAVDLLNHPVVALGAGKNRRWSVRLRAWDRDESASVSATHAPSRVSGEWIGRITISRSRGGVKQNGREGTACSKQCPFFGNFYGSPPPPVEEGQSAQGATSVRTWNLAGAQQGAETRP